MDFLLRSAPSPCFAAIAPMLKRASLPASSGGLWAGVTASVGHVVGRLASPTQVLARTNKAKTTLCIENMQMDESCIYN